MIPFILTIISIVAAPETQVTSQPAHFFYMEVESEDSTAYSTQFGTYQLNDDLRLKKDQPTNFDRGQFITNIDSTLLTLPEEKRNILIYIHGMWAHRDFFQEEVLTRMYEDVLLRGESQYGIVISIIWHSGVNYYDNVVHALNVGEHYSTSVSEILDLDVASTSVMSHSMGNRVFQGIYSQLDIKKYEIPPIEKALFIAADLEENIFEEGQPFFNIGNLVNTPILYVHNNDRSLGMSRALNENDRLGLNADAQTIENNIALKIIDVSAVDDNEGFGPSISNHRYFYTSPTVRKDIYHSLHGTENPLRKDLENPRRQKLLRAKITNN